MIVIVVLLLPGPIAERYTSPTQDGQYLLNPLRAYSFIIALAGVSDGAVLGSSGEALARAKSLFLEHDRRPVLVELLYVVDRDPYVYIRRGGEALMITSPPRLIWEVWGREEQATGEQPTFARAPLDVIGFLDYESGRLLSPSETPQSSTATLLRR